MSDLTAEDRAALLAASMACSHAWDAAFRAHEKLLDVEARCGRRAKDYGGDYLTRRLTDARIDMLDINVLIHKAITDGRDVEWE